MTEPLPPTVRRLGWLHFLNDLTLDFITPLLPAGLGLAWIGVMEGFADGIGQLLKIFTGRASDRSGRRAPWIRMGYSMNAMARPLMAIGLLLAWPLWVVACRVGDRVGKGLRGSSADALVADWTAGTQRDHAYARMRVMDHLGATVGALAAAAVAFWAETWIPWAVALAAIPAAITVWLAWSVRDHNSQAKVSTELPPLDAPTWRTITWLGIAAIGRISPLLVLADLILNEHWEIWKACLVWAGLGLAQAGVAAVAGGVTARYGAALTMRLGWMVGALSFLALSLVHGHGRIAAAIGVAVLAGATEAAEKSQLTSLCGSVRRASALGWLAAITAFTSLIGNGACGWLLSMHSDWAYAVPIAGLVIATLITAPRRPLEPALG